MTRAGELQNSKKQAPDPDLKPVIELEPFDLQWSLHNYKIARIASFSHHWPNSCPTVHPKRNPLFHDHHTFRQ